MARLNESSLWWAPSALLLVVAVFLFYHEHQRTAVTRYMNSPAFFAILENLPKNSGTNNPVSIAIDSSHVTVRVQIRTQEEFDRLTQASRRLDHSAVGRVILVWKGAEYEE